MSEIRILREVEGSKGRYSVNMDGHEAELTYSILSPQTIIADHTGVPNELRGTGRGCHWSSKWWLTRGPKGSKLCRYARL